MSLFEVKFILQIQSEVVIHSKGQMIISNQPR